VPLLVSEIAGEKVPGLLSDPLQCGAVVTTTATGVFHDRNSYGTIYFGTWI